MLATKIVCPHCRRALKTALPLIYAASKSRPPAHARNEKPPADQTAQDDDDPPPAPDSHPVRPNVRPPEQPRLPPEEQKKVEAATAKGLEHLRKPGLQTAE